MACPCAKKGKTMSEKKKKFALSADDILAINDLPQEDVWVDGWGFWVRVQGMTGAQRDAFEESIQGKNGQKIDQRNLRAKLVAQSVIHPETGELLFNQKQVVALGEKSARALTKVFVQAAKTALSAARSMP